MSENNNFNQKDPSDRKPADEQDAPINYDSPQDMVRADLTGENLFVANNSILWAHWKAVPCVLGQTNMEGLRRSHDHAFENQGSSVICENSFTYFKAGEVYGIFTNNSKDTSRWVGGWVPNGQAYITFDRYYKGTKDAVYLSKYDKIVPMICPDDFFAEHSQKLVNNPLGVDKLQFPVHKVIYLSDSAGKRYSQGIDFDVEGCMIKWRAQTRPGLDETSKPRILSVRFRYQPYYYVKYVMHEQRLKAEFDPYLQEIKMKGGPSQCLVEQDYIFQTNEFKDNALNSQVTSGQGGNTSPR